MTSRAAAAAAELHRKTDQQSAINEARHGEPSTDSSMVLPSAKELCGGKRGVDAGRPPISIFIRTAGMVTPECPPAALEHEL